MTTNVGYVASQDYPGVIFFPVPPTSLRVERRNRNGPRQQDSNPGVSTVINGFLPVIIHNLWN